MAIVKANYTRVRAKIKATLRYITHRPNIEGVRQTRQLFGWDGEITKDEAYRMIDEAEKGTIGFRIVLNFDPKRENPNKTLDLRDLTMQFMFKLHELKGKEFQFMAVEHNDHTDLPHIHAIVLLKDRIEIKDFNVLRKSLTREARFRSLQREFVKTRLTGRSIDRQSTFYRPIGMAGGRARKTRSFILKHPCPDCANIKMRRIGSTLYRCPQCGLKREEGLSL